MFSGISLSSIEALSIGKGRREKHQVYVDSPKRGGEVDPMSANVGEKVGIFCRKIRDIIGRKKNLSQKSEGERGSEVCVIGMCFFYERKPGSF